MTAKKLRELLDNAYDDAVVYISLEDEDGNRIDKIAKSVRTEVYDMGEGIPDLICMVISNV